MRHPIHQKIKRYILALIGIGLSGVSVMAQGDHMRFVGVVLNAESGKVLPEVNIFQNKRWVANTSHEGIFDMTIAISDSLVFSHLGFQDIALIVDSILIGDDIMVLTMKPEVKRLDSVTVIGKKKMETVLERENRPEYLVPGFDYSQRGKDTRNFKLGLSGTVSHPLTALYRMISSEYKEEKKYWKLQLRIKEQIRIKEKIHAVLEIMGYAIVDSTYHSFLTHCKMSEEEVNEAVNDYDLYLKIKTCSRSFFGDDSVEPGDFSWEK